jgi:hypothetical protein
MKTDYPFFGSLRKRGHGPPLVVSPPTASTIPSAPWPAKVWGHDAAASSVAPAKLNEKLVEMPLLPAVAGDLFGDFSARIFFLHPTCIDNLHAWFNCKPDDGKFLVT